MNQWRKDNRKKLAKEKEIREKYEWKWEWKIGEERKNKTLLKSKNKADIKVTFSSKIGFWWKRSLLSFK